MNEHDFRVPPAGPLPLPTPDHQRRITGNKRFEVVIVILMIVIGFGYLVWRNSGSLSLEDPARSMSAAAAAVVHEGGVESKPSRLFGREVLSYSQHDGIFDRHIELIGEGPGAPLETAIIWLTPARGKWSPTDNAMLGAVNGVGKLGQKLVWSTGDAIDKAVKTMEPITDTDRPHEKGVAATNDGWKITYVTYRNFDETADPGPALYLVLQRMSAGENADLAVFNRTLYDAIHRGADIKVALQAAGGSPS